MNLSEEETCWEQEDNATVPWHNVSFQVGGCSGGTRLVGATKRPSSQKSLGMTVELQVTWAVLFTSMLVVAVTGNIIVIWSVIAHRRMRTVTNYFLVNLSLADLMMAVFNCMFNFVYMINSDWSFGGIYCTFNNYVANVTVGASVFTLTSITIDRYLAIVRPLKPRMSKTSAQFIIVVIWVLSLLLGSPCLLYSTTITYKPTEQTACIMRWPDGDPMVSTLDYVYNLLLFIVTYLVPMSSMVGCYTAMGRVLWGSKSIGEMTQRQVDSVKSKRKVVRMFLLIVVIFGVCWLPYHSYFIYTYHRKEILYTAYVQHLYLAFYWLAMSNSMLNPMIYYFMNARMRAYFRQAMFSWELRCRKPAQRLEGAETPPIRRYSPSYSRSEELSGTAYEKYKARYIAKDAPFDDSNNKTNPTPVNFRFVERHPHQHHLHFEAKRSREDGHGRSPNSHSNHRCLVEMKESELRAVTRSGFYASQRHNGRAKMSRL